MVRLRYYSVVFRLDIWKVIQCLYACMCPPMFSTEAQAATKGRPRKRTGLLYQRWWMFYGSMEHSKTGCCIVQLQNQVVVHGTYAEAVCRRMAFIVEPLSLCHVSLFWDLVLYEITFIVITPGSSTFQHQPSLK